MDNDAYNEDDGAFERDWSEGPLSSSSPSSHATPTTTATATEAATAKQPAKSDAASSFSPPPNKLTLLPSPIPDDQPITRTNSDLYPSTARMDSIALISVCLRRPETTSRAYDIFRQLLVDYHTGSSAFPEPDLWSSVIEGSGALAVDSVDVSTLGNAKARKQVVARKEMWVNRQERLVRDWEEEIGAQEQERRSRSQAQAPTQVAGWAAGIGHGGEKIYQGFVRGLLHSGRDLEPIFPYLETGSLPIESLLPAFKSTELPILFTALRNVAENHDRPDIVAQIAAIETTEQHREENAIKRQRVFPEVKPVLAKEPYPMTLLAKGAEAGVDINGELPRFAIANLRATLQTLALDEEPRRRQEILEAASLAAARAELEHAAAEIKEQGLKHVEENMKLGSSKLQACMWNWLQEMTKTMSVELAEMGKRAEAWNEWKAKNPDKMKAREGYKSAQSEEADLYVYLDMLSPEKMAMVTIFELLRLSGAGGITDGMKTLRGLVGVGKGVETEYRAETLHALLGKHAYEKNETPRVKGYQIDSMWKRLNSNNSDADVVETIIESASKEGGVFSEDLMRSYGNVFAPDWTQQKHLAIGSFLVDQLIKSAKIVRRIKDDEGNVHTEEQPAFSHAYEYVKGNKQGIIKLNPEVGHMIANDRIGVIIHPKHLPMLVPPRPWTSYNNGAYLFHRVSIMRMKECAEQGTYLRAAAEAGRLDQVFKGLDVLSSTAWKINEGVFNVILEAWNSGQALADIPPAEHLAKYDLPPKLSKEEHNPLAKSEYLEKVKAIKSQMAKDHSERCKFNYQLEIARSYINDAFYIPHNLDFRGRAYPVPPHLSPVGDDLCRGLLTFAEKKKLGKTGLRWLRIHLANLYGYDKASFSDREKFAIDHEAEILESAANPLHGNKWWLKAEEPWQCLATCIELSNALKMDNPEDYMCAQPVHQDGTCNGMQHYAALGGDVQGAKAVNLDAGDKPSDVYTQIADLVNAVVNEDVIKGKSLAQMVQGKITRKVVKQTVMTTVYGVTFIGAKDQIAKQLHARGDIPREHIYQIALYVARIVLTSIGDLFSGARAIQDWLTVCARLISRTIPGERIQLATEPLVKRRADSRRDVTVTDKSGKKVSRLSKELMTSVIWTTPVGLPVVQPYRKAAKKQVKTALQTVFISDPNAVAEVSPQKQATAMPPNFIHSLDATHMLLCAAKCKEDGITFASVHDSYWTHASAIDDLSVNIRDSFVNLHTRDIMTSLREEFLERYADHRILVKSAQVLIRTYQTKGKIAKVEETEEEEEMDEDESTTADPVIEVDEVAGEMTCKIGGKQVQCENINGQAFVKLIDIIPPCPPRGEFDVNRIKQSPYFFS